MGINAEIEFLTRAAQKDAQLRSTLPGLAMGNANGRPDSMQHWSAAHIRTAANRWVRSSPPAGPGRVEGRDARRPRPGWLVDYAHAWYRAGET